MTFPEPSALTLALLHDRYGPPPPLASISLTLALLGLEAHDMLPDLNRLAVPPIIGGVRPAFQLAFFPPTFELLPPIDLAQLRSGS